MNYLPARVHLKRHGGIMSRKMTASSLRFSEASYRVPSNVWRVTISPIALILSWICLFQSERDLPSARWRAVSNVFQVHFDLLLWLLSSAASEYLDGDNAYFCEKCNQKQKGVKKLNISKCPQILVTTLPDSKPFLTQPRRWFISSGFDTPQFEEKRCSQMSTSRCQIWISHLICHQSLQVPKEEEAPLASPIYTTLSLLHITVELWMEDTILPTLIPPTVSQLQTLTLKIGHVLMTQRWPQLLPRLLVDPLHIFSFIGWNPLRLQQKSLYSFAHECK
jgi:hypothetical protein